jgi:hypothetical protein
MLSDLKTQLRAANEALELDLEPPTRAAGSFDAAAVELPPMRSSASEVLSTGHHHD